MDTKVTKKLKINLIDRNFFNGDCSLELDYECGRVDKHVHLSENELLEALEKTNIIDYHKNGRVHVEWAEDYYDPTEFDGHGQREYICDMYLEIFMEDHFNDEDAYKLIRHIEEQARIKQIASRMATKVQNELTDLLP